MKDENKTPMVKIRFTATSGIMFEGYIPALFEFQECPDGKNDSISLCEGDKITVITEEN